MPRTAAKHICFECGTAIGAAHSRRYHASAYRYRLDGQWFRIDRVHGRLRCPHGSCEKTYKDTRSLSRHLEDGKLHEDRYYGVVDFEPLLPSEVRAIDLRARAPSSAVPPPPFSSQQPAPYPSSSMSIPSPLRPPQRGSDPFWDEPVPTLSMLERLTKRNDSPAVQTVAPLSPSGSSASSRERTLSPSPSADHPRGPSPKQVFEVLNALKASFRRQQTPPTPQTLHAHGSPRGADDIVMVSPFVTPEKRVRESPNGSRSPGSLGVASPTDLAHDGGDPDKLEYWPPSPVLVSTDISMASPPRAVPPRAESAPAQPSPAKSRPIIESFALSRSPDVQPYFSTQSRHDLGVFNVSSQPSQILTPSDRDARRAFRQTVQSSFRLPLVKMGYRIHSFYGVLICVECGACRPPGDYVTHAKFHKLPSPSAADVIAITNLCGRHGVLDDPLAVVLPEFGLAPVEALKLHDGWFCTEHVVHYKDGAARGAVQTFFSPVPRRYFHVVPELAGRSPHSLLSAYNAQYASLFSAPSSLIPQPTDSREVTPMERVTGWGKHLGEHICTRNKLRAVLTLTQLPAPSDRASHPLGRLYAIVHQYHQRVAAIHHEAHYRVRCALMDYPQEDARDFRCHTSPHTVSTYLHVLHSLAFALLYQFEPDVSTDYRFPLTAFETAEVRRYRQHLREAPGDSDAETIRFHSFISLFLFPREPSTLQEHDPDDNVNKFKSVLECFCALYLLRDDGSLKQPQIHGSKTIRTIR
ncbi:hypothetical protein B0H10DRAFT_2235586 [Mycena sp. CBHHK59/15]|nr:hypothetical protein B0H10DRAFT_2235586 [Mycena sp. CBHHK59/15]